MCKPFQSIMRYSGLKTHVLFDSDICKNMVPLFSRRSVVHHYLFSARITFIVYSLHINNMRHNIHKDITITNKQLTQPTHQICKVKRLINFFMRCSCFPQQLYMKTKYLTTTIFTRILRIFIADICRYTSTRHTVLQFVNVGKTGP